MTNTIVLPCNHRMWSQTLQHGSSLSDSGKVRGFLTSCVHTVLYHGWQGAPSYHLLIPDSSPLKKTLRQRGRHSKWKEAAAGPRWKNISSWVGVEWEHWLGSKYRSHTSPIFYRQLEHIVFSMILSIGVLHFHIAYSGQYLQYFYYAVKTVWRPWNTRHQKWLQKARQHSILQVCCFLMNSLRYL